MTRDEIAKLSGRELDAAVAERVFKIRPLSIGCDGSTTVPFYSQSNCRCLAEMIAKAREAGWTAEIDDFGNGWHVKLTHAVDGYADRWAGSEGSTLPEAFARALLMATILQEAS